MKKAGFLVLSALLAVATWGCATAPQVKYVTEAEAVTVQALEPVFIESVELERDIKARLPGSITAGGGAENLRREFERVVQKNIKNTDRFKDVMLGLSSGDSYSIVPRIDEASEFYGPLPGDPTRKRLGVKAQVHLDVFLYTRKGEKKLMASFWDQRTKEARVRSYAPRPTGEEMKEYYQKAIEVALASASDKLGSRFNPSYEMGEITKIDGDTAYVRMNTSLFKDMPSKDQAVQVIDAENREIAHIEPIDIEEGLVVGKVFKVAGKAISTGMKTRARVNRLQ